MNTHEKRKSSRLDVLYKFFLIQEQNCKIYYFNIFKNKNKHLRVRQEVKHLNCQQTDTRKSRAILVIDNNAGLSGLNQINRLVKLLHLHCFSCMVVFCSNSELKPLVKVIKGTTQLQTSVFGVHPDYYYCFIPIDSTNRQQIETYMFNLRNEPSWKGKVKKIIKHLMILLGISNRLYEYFLIIAVPEFKK